MTTKLGKNFDMSKAAKSLVRGYKLVPHIDRFLPTWDEEGFTYKSRHKEDDNAWHPSGHCTPSLNALYHMALDHPQERKLAPSSVKNFQVGHFWHQWLQWIVVEKLGFATGEGVERSGMRVWDWDENVNIPDTPKAWHWVTGSGDIAPCSIPEYGDYIVDFKTMNARVYKIATGGLPDDYSAKWECQVNVYMDFFDLERALVVGICKDTPHEMQEFEFRRNQPLIDALYEKWELVSGCIVDEHEPPVTLDYPLPLKGTSK